MWSPALNSSQSLLTMLRSRCYLMLVLLTYLWCATGMDRLASWRSVMKIESAGTVVVMAEKARQLVFHHVGHRDAHEPNTLEVGTIAHADDSTHAHDDHVVTYCDDDSSQATTPKDNKLYKCFQLALPVPILVAFAADTSPFSTTPPEPVQRRASAEFTRTVRLLI